MKTAFAAWNDRIAPVFDVARRLRVIETTGGIILHESDEAMTSEIPIRRAAHLAAMGVATLVCGAISTAQQTLVQAYGITVVPFVAGGLRQVIDAWLTGSLAGGLYNMPGCGPGHGRARRLRRRAGQAADRGRSVRTAGRDCVCPQCGARAEHERGRPCAQMRCPACGCPMQGRRRR